MWGLSVNIACQIHDAEYSWGKTLQDKADADCRLLHNLYIIIESEPVNWLTNLRYQRAECYYEIVAAGGRHAFMKGKEVVT